MGVTRLTKGKLQKFARQKLDVRAPNLPSLFNAVAASLGQPWNGSKPDGYRLLAEFVGVPSIVKPASLRQPGRMAAAGIDVNSDAFLSGYEWRRLRMTVLTKRGARCECCGATAKDGIKLHVDHIKPRRKYPELALVEDNLQILCEVCNHGKGNWDETDWRKYQPAERYEPMWSKRVN